MQHQKRSQLKRGDSYRLCAADFPWAWFTDLEDFSDLNGDLMEEQGGRVGTVYISDEYDLLKVGLDGPIMNANPVRNSTEINEQEKAWLMSEGWCSEIVSIPAKTTLEEFVDLVEKGGGNVYLPSEHFDLDTIKP